MATSTKRYVSGWLLATLLPANALLSTVQAVALYGVAPNLLAEVSVAVAIASLFLGPWSLDVILGRA